jgi:hypothetical protein
VDQSIAHENDASDDPTSSPVVVATTRTLGWSLDFEPPPMAGASASEVAQFLYDDVEGGGLLWDYDEQGDPMPPRWAKEYCEANGHDWRSVSRELRRLRARDIAARASNTLPVVVGGAVALASAGAPRHDIVVRESVVRDLGAAGWLPRCPIRTSGFSPRNNFVPYNICYPCDSWWCPDCGIKKLAQLQDHLHLQVNALPVVYTSVASYEKTKLASRVRQRVTDRNAEMFWYRDLNDFVTYVATDDLGGRLPPNVWTPRPPDAAIRWLRSDVMVFPGHWSHGWSDGWKPPEKPIRRGADGDDDWLWFNLDEIQADHVHKLLCAVVKTELGIDLDRAVDLPSEAVPQIQAILIKVVSELGRRSRLGDE